MMQSFGHWFAYHLLRPTVVRTPPAVWAAACRLLSVPIGLALFARASSQQRRYLRTIGVPAHTVAVVRFAIASAYEKLRHLDFYLYGGIPGYREDGANPPPATPVMYVTVNTYGMETLDAWLDRHAGLVIRRQWDGEDGADPSAAPAVGRWRTHQAALRHRGAGHREILVGANPLTYRKVRGVDRHLIIYQDVWDEQPAAAEGSADGQKTSARELHPLFGRPTPLPLGGLRLAKMAGGLPLRMLYFEHRGGVWVARMSDPVDADPAALIAAMEAEIRRRPAAWMLWPEWLDYQDRHPMATASPADAHTAAAVAGPIPQPV